MKIFKSLVLAVCLLVGSVAVSSAGLYGPLYYGGNTYNNLYAASIYPGLFEGPMYFPKFTEYLDAYWIPVETIGMVPRHLALHR